ncbi:Mitochondrial chaperone Frataxin [Arthrobotrys musiformis]|uniref:ferroxidase n=1 Tax=Arthrobotrys musiformis TaxID=47236 RepID=A0AAV9W8V8_9PEZI
MFQLTQVIRQVSRRCCSSRISLISGAAGRYTPTRGFASSAPSSCRKALLQKSALRPLQSVSQWACSPKSEGSRTNARRTLHVTTRCLAGPTDYTAESAISMDKYHEIADETMDDIFTKLEELAEEVEKGIDVEFSAGVLTLDTPNGTYVINKQPPNKQIWLSSPVSGPKRYDWIEAEGQWVYSRDKSTLSALLTEEVGVEWD